MAQVQYDESGPTVSPDATAPDDYQHIQATPDAFGQQIVQGAEKVEQAAFDLNKFYGQVAADNGTNNTLDAATKILHGDPSKMVPGPDGKPVPDTGYYGLRGADAMRARADTEKQLDEIIQEGRENLTPAAQYQYDADTRRYRAQWAREIGVHADEQQRTWTTDTYNTSSMLALNAIGRNPADPTTITNSTDTLVKAYRGKALANGEDPSGAELRAHQSAAQMQVRSLLMTDPAKAQEAFDANKGLLASMPDYYQLGNEVKAKVIDSQLGPASDAAVAQAKTQAVQSVGIPGQSAKPGLNEAQVSTLIPQLFPGATITSTQRTPQHNVEVGGVPNSMHLSGQAVDFVLPKGTTFAQVKSSLRAQGLPTTELLDEGTHIHWGFGQKGGEGQPAQTYPTVTDAIRGNYEATVDQARAFAQKQWPQYPDAQDRYVSRVQRGLDMAIAQQNQQYEIAAHTVQVAMTGTMTNGHAPTNEQELTSVSPQVAQAWKTMQVSDPYKAMSVERIFDANAKGKAIGYGTQFNSLLLDRVLAPAGDPKMISNPSSIWPYVGPGEDAPLTNTGLSALSEIMAKRGTPQGEQQAGQLRAFFQKVHGVLSQQAPASGIFDRPGEQRFTQYVANALPFIKAEEQAGKPLSEILKPKGDLENMAHMMDRTMQQKMKDRILDGSSVAAPDQSPQAKQAAQIGAFRSAYAAAKTDAQRQEVIADAKRQGFQYVPKKAAPPVTNLSGPGQLRALADGTETP